MATEDILIRYRADVSQLETDINKVIASQEELTQATQQNTQAQQKAVTSAEFAAKKRAQLLDLEVQKLKQLQAAQKLAFDPKEIQKYNDQIASTQKRVELLGGTYQTAANKINKAQDDINKGFDGTLNQLNKIGSAFGIAFSVEALVQFGQKAVNAFLDAEAASSKLRFAITEIGNEGEDAFQRLSDQADRFQQTSIFDADDIRKAQAALAEFGLTSQQIENAIPGLIDYASKTGDLLGAVNSVGSALEGRAGEFKAYGLEVDASATKQENLNKVLNTFIRFQGNAEEVLKTTEGQLKQTQNATEDYIEAIGKGIVVYINEFAKFASELVTPLIDAVKQLGNALANLIPEPLLNKLKELGDGTSALGIAFKLINAPILLAAKAFGLFLEAATKVAGAIGGLVNVFKVGFQEIGNTVTSVGGGISDTLDGIASFDSNKIKTGLGKVKGAFSQAGVDLADAFNKGYDDTLKVVQSTSNAVAAADDKILSSVEIRKKSTKELTAELEKQKQLQGNAARQNVEAIEKELEARKKQADASKKSGEEAAKAVEEFKKLLASLDAEIAKVQADLERRKIEIIPADSQKAQEDRIKALADLNEKAINDEIAGKIKLVQEDSKLTTEQKNQAIAKYEELKAARLALAQFNEQNELNLISAAQIDRIEAAAKQLDDLNIEQALIIEADKVEAANASVAKSFEDLGKAVSKDDFAAAKEAVTARTAALNQALTEENNINKTRIENARETELAKIKEGDAAEAERAAINLKYNNQIENADKELNDKLAANNKELNDTIATETQRATDARIAQTFQVLDATKQLVSELTGLYDQFSEQRIAKIEEERDLALESIDAQIEQNAEYLEKRRISEEEAAANEKALLDEKVRLEAAAQKKIREEKRKQAILDKAAATFEIGLQTAIALVAAQKEPPPLNAILSAIIAATSAAQLAAVAAQPIPYRKGSKDTGRKEHLARVGEEGEELVWMPANSKVLPAKQTRKYSDIIDAMYDNKLDDYVYKNYITPALMAQKEAKENQRAKSFAENMANSIVYNQAGLTPSDLEAQRKRGQYIRNVDEIAEAIAKKLPIRDIYRA